MKNERLKSFYLSSSEIDTGKAAGYLMIINAAGSFASVGLGLLLFVSISSSLDQTITRNGPTRRASLISGLVNQGYLVSWDIMEYLLIVPILFAIKSIHSVKAHLQQYCAS